MRPGKKGKMLSAHRDQLGDEKTLCLNTSGEKLGEKKGKEEEPKSECLSITEIA